MARTVSGPGTLSQLAALCADHPAGRILLVTGKGSYAASGARPVVEAALVGRDVLRFSDFDVNPKLGDAKRGVALAREKGIDLIVAVGGGSVMDMAKLIKALHATPEQAEALAKGETAMRDPGIPLIAVPTTAGSGSEATHFAVVYIGTDKYSLASGLLRPDAVILDGALTASGSAYQKACNGLDALSQGIESAWAAGSTGESREHAFRAVALCAAHLPRAVRPEAEAGDLQGMIEAANLAGRAIDISKTTAAHAWSYALTSHHGVPHGHAVWLTLPAIFALHAKAADAQITDPRGPAHLRAVMERLMTALGIADPAAAGDALRASLAGLGVEADMAKLGADTADQRHFLSGQVNMQRMSNNPVALDARDIAAIFAL